MDIFAKCRWCAGRGRQDGLNRDSAGPCQFCGTERARHEQESAARYQLTGTYRDPEFEGHVGEVVYYDVKADKIHTLRSGVTEIVEQVM